MMLITLFTQLNKFKCLHQQYTNHFTKRLYGLLASHTKYTLASLHRLLWY